MCRLKLVLFIISVFAFVINNAYANCVQNHNKLGLVGLDSQNGSVYAAVSEHDNACACSFFRFTVANTDTKMALSVLLSARMAGKKVRIDILESVNCNTAYRVYIQDQN